MNEKKKPGISLPIASLAVIIGCIAIDAVFLVLFSSQVKTVTLLRSEASMLHSANQAVNVSSSVLDEYTKQTAALAQVFPNEETIPTFIQALESRIRDVSSEYSFKFNSLTPIQEQDKLYLLMTINMKTDFQKLERFLGELETLPYMTHVVSIQDKAVQEFAGDGDVRIGLKVYVQNPFTTK